MSVNKIKSIKTRYHKAALNVRKRFSGSKTRQRLQNMAGALYGELAKIDYDLAIDTSTRFIDAMQVDCPRCEGARILRGCEDNQRGRCFLCTHEHYAGVDCLSGERIVDSITQVPAEERSPERLHERPRPASKPARVSFSETEEVDGMPVDMPVTLHDVVDEGGELKVRREPNFPGRRLIEGPQRM